MNRKETISELIKRIEQLTEYIKKWDEWIKTVKTTAHDFCFTHEIDYAKYDELRLWLIDNNRYEAKSGTLVLTTCLTNFPSSRLSTTTLSKAEQDQFNLYHSLGRTHLGKLKATLQEQLVSLEGMNDFDFEGLKNEGNILKNVYNIIDKFHRVARQLRSRRENRETIKINDEYDVQDLIHALLRLYSEDIRKEEWTPSYAGGSSRMDFLLKGEELVLEIKYVKEGRSADEIGKELIVDKEKYKQHPNCKVLVCFIYDPNGILGNPAELENDLSCPDEEFTVIVLVSPKS